MRRLLASCKRLGAVQRLRELELRQARVRKSTADRVAAEHGRAVESLQRQIAETHSLTESHVTSARGINGGLMRQLADYANWQARTLDEREAELRRLQEAAERARADVVRCFERLSVIERLRGRRERDLALEAARMEQKILDDHGAIVAARGG